MTRADRKNAVLRKTRLKFQQPFAAAGRPLARNYEALSKTRYNFVRISNFGLKFLQYIFNTLYTRTPIVRASKIRALHRYERLYYNEASGIFSPLPPLR